MGVLNITPDSFSDGGRWLDVADAVRQAQAMQDAGADLIDIGGESTRPGAEPVSVHQELERVIPVIESVVARLRIPVSIDTSKPEVMRQAVAAGAGMINDVNALRQGDAVAVAAELAVPVCLMHMQGQPRVMQEAPSYTDVVHDVQGFLLERAHHCEDRGVARGNIVLDPGFGFGKTLQHNLDLFTAIPAMAAHGYPLLIGVSRKAMIGQFTNRETDCRVAGSIVAAALAALKGASILRVHDVAETSDALKVATALWSPRA
jgi:dihydropteroate synthase